MTATKVVANAVATFIRIDPPIGFPRFRIVFVTRPRGFGGFWQIEGQTGIFSQKRGLSIGLFAMTVAAGEEVAANNDGS